MGPENFKDLSTENSILNLRYDHNYCTFTIHKNLIITIILFEICHLPHHVKIDTQQKIITSGQRTQMDISVNSFGRVSRYYNTILLYSTTLTNYKLY